MSARATNSLDSRSILSIHQLKDTGHLCLRVWVIIPFWTERLSDNMFTVNQFCFNPVFVVQILNTLKDAKMSWVRGMHSSWARGHTELKRESLRQYSWGPKRETEITRNSVCQVKNRCANKSKQPHSLSWPPSFLINLNLTCWDEKPRFLLCYQQLAVCTSQLITESLSAFVP